MPYHLTQKQFSRSVRTSLWRNLSKPDRKALKDRFEAEHKSYSDTELYEYLKEHERRFGRGMTPENTIGFLYFCQTIGIVVAVYNADK
jgi:hypothetical protein